METLVWIVSVDGGLRAGWRWLLSLAFVVGAILVGSVPIIVATVASGEAPPLMVAFGLQSFALGTSFFLMTALMGLVLDIRVVDGKLRRGRVRGSGIGPPAGRALGEIVLGAVFGALALVPAVGIMALGGMEVELPSLGLTELGLLALIALGAVFAAAWEELFFRGYSFAWFGASFARLLSWGGRSAGLSPSAARRLGHALGFGLPAVGGSALFGAAHLMNDGAAVLSSLNTALAGLWLAVIVLRTRSLWVAIAAHWSWNAVHGLVLGFPVSGVSGGDGFAIPSLIRLHATGPDWIGGGSYGVEGSIGATVAMVLFTLLALLLPRRPAEHAIAAMVESLPIDPVQDEVTEPLEIV